MKIKNILLACLTAFTMTACNNVLSDLDYVRLSIEPGQVAAPEGGEKLFYEIKVKGETSSEIIRTTDKHETIHFKRV